jgi:hypothetical protein
VRSHGGDVYAADDNIELVGAATPFGLKLLESRRHSYIRAETSVSLAR